jgi:hypothetical protein
MAILKADAERAKAYALAKLKKLMGPHGDEKYYDTLILRKVKFFGDPEKEFDRVERHREVCRTKKGNGGGEREAR